MESLSRSNLMDFVLPGTLAVGMSLATWLVLPNALRRCHSYMESGAKARMLGPHYSEPVPFHLSVFGALEDPARLFAGALTFSYLGYLVAPISLGAQYLGQIRSGVMVLSVIWFLYLYKRNVFTRIVAGKNMNKDDRDRYLTMDRLSSIALLLLGSMAFAESFGVAVQSVLTVGGIGGVATAFAARDILGNLLSGLGIQFARPFIEGDYITAGNLSGQVVDIGLHSTEVLNHDKFPTMVPNSFFSSQVIVNRSRVKSRKLELNVPVKLTSLEKLPAITSEIRSMLHSNPRVFLDDEKPRCHVSQVNPNSFNVVVSCNLKPMSEGEVLGAQEALLLEASRIVVRNDPEPDPDSDKSFSEAAEMVEKPVVLSTSSSPETDDHHDDTTTTALGKLDDMPEPVAVAAPVSPSPFVSKDDEGSYRAHSNLFTADSAPKRSPSITRNSDVLRQSESPRTPRTGMLGVGSKLLSRMRQTKR